MSNINKIEDYNPEKAYLTAEASVSDGTNRVKDKPSDFLSYGHVGDQTGVECRARQYEPHYSGGGFGNIFRFHDENIRHKIAKMQLQMCANGNVGYSQGIGKTYWKWRGAYMRAMCANQQGIDMEAWGNAGFPRNWGKNHLENVMNMREIDLTTLDPSMADVPCNTDCSASALSQIQITTGLWFHCAYRYGTYTRWMDTVPTAYYGMKGGGWQQGKFYRNTMCCGKETTIDYNSLGYYFNEAKCDWIDYEDYDVLDCPWYTPTEEQKDPDYWGSSSTVYNDELHPSDTYDSTLTNWAPPTYGGRNIRVWHIGFNPSNTAREVNYRYRPQAHWPKGSPNTSVRDANGNIVRWNLYVYGYGSEAPTKTWINPDIEEESATIAYRRHAGNYNWHYDAVMTQFIVAEDNEQLLESVYDDAGDFVAYEKMDGTRPWVSEIKCAQWCRNEPDLVSLDDTATTINNQPYILRYSNYEQYMFSKISGDGEVTGTLLDTNPRVSGLRYYMATNKSAVWSSRENWPDRQSDWRTYIVDQDATLSYGQNEGWTALPGAEYGWYDTSAGSTLIRTNWTSRDRYTKVFKKKVRCYPYYRQSGNYTEMTFPAGSTRPSSDTSIYFTNVGTEAAPVWAYYAASSKTGTVQGSVVWVHTTNDMNPTDDLFPYFTVQACPYDAATNTFVYNGTTYTLTRTAILYSFYVYSSGYWYTQWDEYASGGREYYVETTKEFNVEESEQHPSEGTEDDPENENMYFWLKLEDGVWSPCPSPFGDQETDDEDEEVEVVDTSNVPVLKYPSYLWSGDILLTRSGAQGNTTSGGHVALWT